MEKDTDLSKYNPNFIENLYIYIDRIWGGHIEEKLQGNN